MYCCHSRTAPACLSSARWGLAISQMACSKAAPCSSGRRPLSTSSRRPRVQVMLSARRSYNAWSSATAGGASLRAATDMALGALPSATRASSASLSGVANSAAAATWSRCQRAGAEGVVERGQVAQRVTGVRDAHRGAVVAARDLRQPLRAGGAAGGLPITLVVGLTHDLRQPLRQTRLLAPIARTSRRRASRRRSSP